MLEEVRRRHRHHDADPGEDRLRPLSRRAARRRLMALAGLRSLLGAADQETGHDARALRLAHHGSFLRMARRTIRAPNLTRMPDPLHRGQEPKRRRVLPGFVFLPLHHRHGPKGHSHSRASHRTAIASTSPASARPRTSHDPGRGRTTARDLAQPVHGTTTPT